MRQFRAIVFAAVCAGVLAGLVAAIGHQFGTVPLILRAEVYEHAAAHAAGTVAEAHSHTHAHAAGGVLSWRTLRTTVADMLAGTGFALLLVAGLSLSGARPGWRQGLLWGLAGFAAFVLAPGLGLPPEVPGTESAPLADRQLWWCMTALLTAAGLGVLAFRRGVAWLALGAALLVAPHLIPAPEPEVAGSLAPAALAHQFVWASGMVNLVFWLSLGVLGAVFARRFGVVEPAPA